MAHIKIKKQKILFSLLALFAGALLPLAFAPFGYYLLAEISLILLLVIWINTASPGWAFWYGWLFGLTFFSCGVYWVYISIHHFGNAPVILAVLILSLLIAFMALYPALNGYLLNRFYPKNNWHKLLLAFPASWVILEWIRGWFLSGFPWLFLGYSHIDSYLGTWAKIFGVYGLSFFIAQTAGAIVCLYLYRKKVKTVAMIALLVIALWSFGGYLVRVKWSRPVGDLVQVSLIQGNIPLQRKWDANELLPILDSYADLTKQNLASKLIVWPEAAIPASPEEIPFYLKALSKLAKTYNITILSGAPFYDSKNKRTYNGILTLGAQEGHYYKRHLVPFGEYLPLRFMLSWLRNYLLIPMSDCSSGGTDQADLFFNKTILAPFICYEIAYGGLVLDYLPRAGLLVTVCDDSWFGESIAAAQHLEIVRMRSLETERYQLLCTNTGITAIIDAVGKIVTQAPTFQPAVLTSKIQILSGATPWIKYGQYLWLWLLLLALWVARQKNKS